MTFRTDGQIILAVNLATDLTNLVKSYLELWKKHANGINGVWVPSDEYTVIFKPTKQDGFLSIVLSYTRTSHWEEPTYCDVDSDYFSESYGGSSNVSGSISRSEDYHEEKGFQIPFTSLLRTFEGMEENIKKFAAENKRKEDELVRARKIKELEDELKELKK